MKESKSDLAVVLKEGRALLSQGLYDDAIKRFDHCLDIDAKCVDAVEAKAEALHRLGRQAEADEYRKLADIIRRDVSDEQVTASVRAEHPCFRRGGARVGHPWGNDA